MWSATNWLVKQRHSLNKARVGYAVFDAVLVLDVTRWGRFQNTDEGAFYEFLCWRAGVRVLYVGESFENDQSPFFLVFKGIKRAMAAEYSRELSVKVSAAQRRLAKMGYRQGAIAGYGLRRLLLSADGEAKFLLAEGDRKSLASDRIVLVPGPPEEIQTVRWIFDRYLDGKGCSAIAHELNDKGILSHRGKTWVVDQHGQIRFDVVRHHRTNGFVAHQRNEETEAVFGVHDVLGAQLLATQVGEVLFDAQGQKIAFVHGRGRSTARRNDTASDTCFNPDALALSNDAPGGVVVGRRPVGRDARAVGKVDDELAAVPRGIQCFG
jgi:DNA invertase Pin-like site-specific DNA recombinase